MGELHAWDLDGTIRPGSLLADAIAYGAEAGFIDLSIFKDPHQPAYDEVPHFLQAITERPRHIFNDLMDKISDEATQKSYPWALERLEVQAQAEHVVILSHSPDFLVKAFARGLGVVRRGRGSYFHTSGLIFSGRAITLDKKRAIRKYIRDHAILSVDFAAGDSEPDVPILQMAQHAVIVNPNEHLRDLAAENGWEVIRTDNE